MFKSAHRRRSGSLPYVIFRLLISLVIFLFLLGGLYSAYKHFSGLDPLKLDPQAILNDVLSSKLKTVIPKDIPVSLNSPPAPTPTPSAILFKFLLVADSHSENDYLKRAIAQSKAQHPEFIIGLGDYSEVGTVKELEVTKQVLDSEGIRYFLLPGDHDLWDSRNRQLPPNTDFAQVFGLTYQSFTFDGVQFLLVNNSDNYAGIDSEENDWIRTQLDKAMVDRSKLALAFVHEPLYHPSSDHFMGRVEKKLLSQAKNLTRDLKSAGYTEVFAGDIHFFTSYIEPETGLKMTTIGALASQRNAQSPRYGLVTVYRDYSYKVDDVEVK